jgi:plasmid stabilization system protein ParE
MTRARFVLSPEALQDFDEIWLHIAEDNIAAADQVEQKLRDAIKLLTQKPEIGHVREDLTDQAVKFWTVDAYLIVYDPATTPLHIVRVLHGSRDIPGLL